MNMTLPDGNKIYLDTKLSYEERKAIVDQLIADWKDHFEQTWNQPKTRVCLDILANYLVLVKSEEDKGKHDKTILSLKKMQKMVRGDDKVTHFSDLTPEQQSLFGLIDGDTESE